LCGWCGKISLSISRIVLSMHLKGAHTPPATLPAGLEKEKQIKRA